MYVILELNIFFTLRHLPLKILHLQIFLLQFKLKRHELYLYFLVTLDRRSNF